LDRNWLSAVSATFVCRGSANRYRASPLPYAERRLRATHRSISARGSISIGVDRTRRAPPAGWRFAPRRHIISGDRAAAARQAAKHINKRRRAERRTGVRRNDGMAAGVAANGGNEAGKRMERYKPDSGKTPLLRKLSSVAW